MTTSNPAIGDFSGFTTTCNESDHDRLRGLISRLSQPAVLSLRDGTVIGANPSWWELTGIACDAAFPEGTNLRDLAAQHVDQQSASDLETSLQSLASSSPTFRPFAVHFLRDGMPQVWQFAVIPLLAPNAEVVAAIWTLADITDSNLHSGVGVSHENTRRTVAQLSADIAHDFNNLLTPVVGDIELARTPFPEKPFESPDAPCPANRHLQPKQVGAFCESALDDSGCPPARIGFVDNEPGIRRIGRMMLELLGHAASVFASGHDLLNAIADGIQLDIILLDCCMPELSGCETFRRLRTAGCSIPVVVCSGTNFDLTTFRSDVADAPVGFLAKPFRLATLDDVICRALRTRS